MNLKNIIKMNCEVCGKSFKSKSGLTLHIKKNIMCQNIKPEYDLIINEISVETNAKNKNIVYNCIKKLTDNGVLILFVNKWYISNIKNIFIEANFTDVNLEIFLWNNEEEKKFGIMFSRNKNNLKKNYFESSDISALEKVLIEEYSAKSFVNYIEEPQSDNSHDSESNMTRIIIDDTEKIDINDLDD